MESLKVPPTAWLVFEITVAAAWYNEPHDSTMQNSCILIYIREHWTLKKNSQIFFNLRSRSQWLTGLYITIQPTSSHNVFDVHSL